MGGVGFRFRKGEGWVESGLGLLREKVGWSRGVGLGREKVGWSRGLGLGREKVGLSSG